jgi:hypothetical protein
MASKDWAMRSVLHILTVVAVGAIGTSPAIVAAQSAEAPNQRSSAPGWVFTPSIAAGVSWDSNVLLIDPDSNPPGDYGSPFSPSASLDYTGKYTRFSSGYSGSFVRYRTLDSLNSFEQSFRAMMERRVNARLSFFGDETLTMAPTTDVLHLSGVPFYRVGSRSNSVEGGIQTAFDKHTTLRGAYQLHSVAFDVNNLLGTQLQGGHAHEITMTLNHEVSRHLTIGGEYEFTRAIVNSQTALGSSGPEDRFNMNTGTVTAQYEVASGTMLSGGLGVAQIGAGLSHQARTGPEWSAGISQHVGRGLVAARYRKSHVPSFGFGGTFQNQELTANVHVPIGRTRAYTDGIVSWLNNEPLDTFQPSLQTMWLTGNVGYAATRWLALEGFFDRTQQDSQRAGGQLQRNQLGFRVVAAKPVKLR